MLLGSLIFGAAPVAAQPPPAPPVAPEPPAPVTTHDLIAALIESLRDTDSEVRLYSAAALGNVGAEAVAPLTTALQDRVPVARAAAAYALGQIGAPARSATPLLMKALKDNEKEVRRQAAQALGRIIAADRLPTSTYPTLPPAAPPPVFPRESLRP
jgi:hypothetical protein